jgi:regulatory protein YycH of two-component signal transduction system YycFG
MCEITRQVATQSKNWPQPLTTAQLIFAYTTPLSIRFRMDEKRFDVDGAYNVRYEILKKRIDKAVIAGTNERITQSGHVSVVYLQEKDRQEYLKYAVYLLHHGYITGPPQDYELGALQGVQGLRALRMEVASL